MTMDIHRSRFVPYPPSTINALAFSHPSTRVPPPSLRLAIGRANGDIEIWNPLQGAWFHETTLRGGKERSIEGLVWIQEPDELNAKLETIKGKLRLFSIGYSSTVTEWDLSLGKPARHSSGNYGEVWCIAAQPKWRSSSKSTGGEQKNIDPEGEFRGQNLIVGCADGAVIVLSTSNDDLKFQKALSRPSAKKARILSITFQTRHIAIAGCADSMIRVYDTRNGSLLRTMSLSGGGPKGGPKEVLVWSVKCFSDGTIVSGDSNGEVRFWDGKNFTLMQRLKGHEADVLDVGLSNSGDTVISGGMDRRSILYRLVGTGKGYDRKRWTKVTHQRFHDHDVKAMAVFEGRGLNVVASGGLDTTPIIIPFREFGREAHFTLSSLPQQPVVQSSPLKRLVMSWWEQEVRIWRVALASMDEAASTVTSIKGRKLVARITLSGEENIASACLSSDGSILAIATIAEIKIFTLRESRSASEDVLKVNKLDTGLALCSNGAKLVQFSPDSRWLFLVGTDSKISALRVMKQEDVLPSKGGFRIHHRVVRLTRLYRHKWQSSERVPASLGNYNRVVCRLAFSSDSRIVVAGDLLGFLDSWVLEGYEDLTLDNDNDSDSSSGASSDSEKGEEQEGKRSGVLLGQKWIRNPSAALLPKLPSAPLVLTFRPASETTTSSLPNRTAPLHPTRNNPYPHSHDRPITEDRLFVLTSQHQAYEFSVLTGQLTPWSQRNPSSRIPRDFSTVRSRAMGSIWDIQGNKERLWLYGSSWIWMFDMSRDFPARIESPPTSSEQQKLSRKRKRAERDSKEAPSGAGGRIKEDELETGIGSKIRIVQGVKSDDEEWISLEPKPDADAEDSADEDGEALATIRRKLDSGGDTATADDDASQAVKDQLIVRKKEETSHETPGWWCTYKYRPILGAVPIGSRRSSSEKDNGDDKDFSEPLEVVVIERPMFEVDLPPRYEGEQEWVK